MTKRVLVAMSGGIDSGVAAALLKEEGYEVIGVTMQLWPKSKLYERPKDLKGCCGTEEITEAKKTARKLKIPHYVLNFREIFEKKVITDFCTQYRQGKTPNPCIQCNKYIKFDILLKKAKELKADYLATGHYVRLEYKKKENRYLLKKSIDKKKDQSYVLYVLTQDMLKNALFPLGKLTKEKVRKIAKNLRLANAAKPESQEICFIPDNNYHTFIKKHIPKAVKPGPILNSQGKIIGHHKGIPFYTIGQRRGMGIAAPEPLYVTAIDKKNNALTAGKKKEAYADRLIADKINFIAIQKLAKPLKVTAKIRYLHKEAKARILPLPQGRIQVKFEKPQWAVTPGQAVVFYKGQAVLGGGTII